MIAFNVLVKKVKNLAEGEFINFERTLKANNYKIDVFIITC